MVEKNVSNASLCGTFNKRRNMKKFKWQDIAFMIGGFIFALSLVAILNDVQMSVVTTLSTVLVLTVFLICYASMKFWLAFTSTILTAAAWYWLFFMSL